MPRKKRVETPAQVVEPVVEPVKKTIPIGDITLSINKGVEEKIEIFFNGDNEVYSAWYDDEWWYGPSLADVRRTVYNVHLWKRIAALSEGTSFTPWVSLQIEHEVVESPDLGEVSAKIKLKMKPIFISQEKVDLTSLLGAKEYVARDAIVQKGTWELKMGRGRVFNRNADTLYVPYSQEVMSFLTQNTSLLTMCAANLAAFKQTWSQPPTS